MAIDLTGISSVNEFYTDHYLATYFEQGVKETVQKWRTDARESDEKTPWQRLRDAGKRFYRLFGSGQATRGGSYAEQAFEMMHTYLDCLGYPTAESDEIALPDGTLIPLCAEYLDNDDRPRVWVIATIPNKEDDVLSSSPLSFGERDQTGLELNNEEILNSLMLDVHAPARFVILASPKELVLVDRNKWSEKRYISFDMEEIYRRHEESTFQAVATLLAYSSLCPNAENPLLDDFDQQAREHASEVSDSLRYSLRECVELLGNEVIYDWVHNKGFNLDTNPIDADELTVECLRYMYRMLFLLFMEARPDLGFSPTKSDAYQKSYSLESIRSVAESYHDDVEAMSETNYIDQTMRVACQLVYDGYPMDEQRYQELVDAGSTNDVFVVPPLKAHIFDRERTPLIDSARLRDSVMLQIVDKMSYTHPAKGRSERVSYGTLGINQLGSVYEALLSYRGFIATELLYEVKRTKDKFDPLDVGYFVTEAELDYYTEDERVRYEKPDPRAGELRTYEQGHFIYRLAGREREQSASYYTPESLTKCLVKYALKELLQDKTADEILSLTVCEPAMGSAAFLNEAVNQLAEAYLARKQEETGVSIPHDRRQLELQRVKMFIADRNVYGIDLNPIAVELGEVSLWLNTISQDGHVPWFGNQLHCGNSLIGARRQGYTERDLSSKTKGIRWYDHEPERVGFNTGCSKSHRIYHFLVGDPGMADYRDKVIKELEPDAITTITRWRKTFTQPYQSDEVKSLRELSYVIDDLWAKQVEQQRVLRRRTIDELHCFGYDDDRTYSRTSIRQKDKVLAEFYRSEHARNAGPYARLKFAMDYWCSLWFWPIDKADLLPSRDEFLMDMSFILIGTVTGVVGVEEQAMQQTRLDLGEEFETDKDRELRQMQIQFGLENEVDLDKLCNQFPRLALVREIARQQHFFHWELEFADMFEARGGFDLLLGNPPWIKLEWNEQAVLSDSDPRFAIKKLSADQTARRRKDALESSKAYRAYIAEYARMTGQKCFLNAAQNYPLLKGQQTNLYKCFLPQAWSFSHEKGISSFIHPDGVFNDPKAAALRAAGYLRLRTHFQFVNELKLFAGVHHQTVFSLNTYGSSQKEPKFDSIYNLYATSTIEQCYNSDGTEPIPRIKSDNGSWETRGHKSRIVDTKMKGLVTFATLFGDHDWKSSRLLSVHAKPLMDALSTISANPTSFSSFKKQVFPSECWHETGSQKDGTIIERVDFAETTYDSILSGAHIGVANPLLQTMRAQYRNNSDYDPIDLSGIPENYLSRTRYKRNVSRDEYISRTPRTNDAGLFSEHYRIAFRHMIGCSSERSMQAAILVPGQMWINGILGCHLSTSEAEWINEKTHRSYRLLSWLEGCLASLPIDYCIRAIGKTNLSIEMLGLLPVVSNQLTDEVICRTLLLNCLTRDYAELWSDVWQSEFTSYSWSRNDSRLSDNTFSNLTDEWCWETPLRKDYERRQALVELDVLVSMALGLTLEQLITVYQLDFSVLQSYERETWYDVNGRVVCSKKAMGNFKFKPTEFKKEFGDINKCTSGVYPKTFIDDTLPGGPVERTIEYVAPFDTCDRVEDYRTAWAFFSQKYGLDNG